MNPESENFDSLRRLLALKRHEVPPPGYFNRFSRDVMARIKVGDGGDAIGAELPWFQRVFGMFELKPMFAGAFGMTVCALLISGVVSSESGSSPVATVETPESSRASFVFDSTRPAMGTDAKDVSFAPGNTNPVVSLFDQYQPQVPSTPAGYWIRGN
ncbi:MAG TPA: hypothetical protein VKV04_08100 [Verrucomicrobiae bacterium]|nr:hypothetical protein [Verrucomicrobiae bacterium]